MFERIPNIGPNQIPEYYLQEQIDRIEYQIIQTQDGSKFCVYDNVSRYALKIIVFSAIFLKIFCREFRKTERFVILDEESGLFMPKKGFLQLFVFQTILFEYANNIQSSKFDQILNLKI